MKQFTRNASVIMTLWVSLTMFLQLRPIDDHDIFTWIQLGQIILNKHTLVVKEPFSYLLEGQLIPTERWLSYIIWAILYRLGSWPLIKLVHDFIFTGAFILAGSVALVLSKRTQIRVRLFCLCLAIVMGFLVAATNSSVRSQGFAILCFSLLFYACQSNWPLKKQLLIIVPVLLLWQNIHPSLIMGIILLCVMFLKRFTNNVQTVKQFKTLSIITGIAVMLYFATPDGFQLIEITQTHTIIARSILGISEWMPPWDASVRNAMVMFWLAVVITIIMIVKSPKRIAVSDLIGTVIFCGASFYMSRLSLFWAVFMVPTWAFLLEQFVPTNLFRWHGDEQIRIRSVFLIGTIFLFLIVLVLQDARFSKDIPLEGIEKLRRIVPSGRIYNCKEYGGALMFIGYPSWQVTIDGRHNLYDRDIWQKYYYEAAGKTTLTDLVKEHSPSAFVLNSKVQAGLIKRLSDSNDWNKVYDQDNCVIFTPNVK